MVSGRKGKEGRGKAISPNKQSVDVRQVCWRKREGGACACVCGHVFGPRQEQEEKEKNQRKPLVECVLEGGTTRS